MSEPTREQRLDRARKLERKARALRPLVKLLQGEPDLPKDRETLEILVDGIRSAFDWLDPLSEAMAKEQLLHDAWSAATQLGLSRLENEINAGWEDARREERERLEPLAQMPERDFQLRVDRYMRLLDALAAALKAE